MLKYSKKTTPPPPIIKSIMEHRDSDVNAGDDEEGKQDGTKDSSIDSNDVDIIDYNFYYKNNANSNEQVGAGAIYIADTSVT